MNVQLTKNRLLTIYMPKASPPIPPAHPAPASYEAALKELEALVADMEAGQLPLA